MEFVVSTDTFFEHGMYMYRKYYIWSNLNEQSYIHLRQRCEICPFNRQLSNCELNGRTISYLILPLCMEEIKTWVDIIEWLLSEAIASALSHMEQCQAQWDGWSTVSLLVSLLQLVLAAISSRIGYIDEKKLSTLRMTRHWNRFSREVVDVPCLEESKSRLDGILRNLV